jgi:hypothetical protein
MWKEPLKSGFREWAGVWRRLPLVTKIGLCIFLAASGQDFYLIETATPANFRAPERVRLRKQLILLHMGGIVLAFGGLLWLKAEAERQRRGEGN